MTDVEPDLKPPAAVKDPALLREIHEAYQSFGCSLCGYIPRSGAVSGWQVEVHHIIGRRHGDDSWENSLGLCGELTPNKCHWRKTTNRITIAFVVGAGWVATDAVTGDETVLRQLSEESQDIQRSLGGVRSQPQAPVPVEALVPARDAPDLEKLRMTGEAGAVERFQMIQQLMRRAENDFLAACLLVADVAKSREWAIVGYSSMKEYAEAARIPQPTLSKMLKVSKVFRGRWQELSHRDQQELSIDKLYYAGKLLTLGAYSSDMDALHSAVAVPQRYLYQQYMEKRLEGQNATLHECPTCGRVHLVKEERDEAVEQGG